MAGSPVAEEAFEQPVGQSRARRGRWTPFVLVLILLAISDWRVRERSSIIGFNEMLIWTALAESSFPPTLPPPRNVVDSCRRMARELQQPESMCPVKCIRVKRTGRWGNQVVQLLGSLQVAEDLRAKLILFRPNSMAMRKGLRYNKNIRFAPDNFWRRMIHRRCLKSKWFKRITNRTDLAFLNLTLEREFRERYLKSVGIPSRETPDDELVIYVRGGDIFLPYIHICYAQPPCAFYDDIIRERNWSRVVLVAEDDSNPCVARIKRHGAFHKIQDWDSDLMTMMNARNLVIGRGTLGIAVAVLSTKLTNLYTFNLSCSRLHVARHRNCIPDDDYYRNVITQYDNISDKKGPLLTYPSGTWEEVQYGLKEKERIYMHDNLLSLLL